MAGASHTMRRLAGRWRAMRHARADAHMEPQLQRGESGTLVLSPHLDDAVLDCWGELTSGDPVRVVNLFAGVPPAGTTPPLWDRITGATDSSARVRERLAEDASALALAGREPVNLPLLDAQYPRPERPEPETLDRELAARLEGERFARVLAPAAIGGHPDHVLARRYARVLARAGFAVTLYADLPYCVAHGWPGWVDGRGDDPYRDVDPFWSSFLAGVPELGELRAAQVVRLDGAAAAAKLEAMRCYRSQLPALAAGARGLLEDPEIHRYEVSWQLGVHTSSRPADREG
jgi:LmbE family N-acetylglucosaminyl deacetylase